MSEGVCEAPTFIEWSLMVVPTYPEGGSHALQVCQHHHQVVRVGDFVRGCQRLKENTLQNRVMGINWAKPRKVYYPLEEVSK